MLLSLQDFALQPNGYSLALWGVAVITTALALFCWSRRPASGASLLAWMMLAVTIWAGAYGLELASLDLAAMRFWVRVEYLGIPIVPVLWLLFALQYSGHDRWLARPVVLLLFVVPLCTLLLNYTNKWHHLYYTSVSVDYSGPFPVLALQKGPWYWVNAAYAYLCLLAGSTLLLRHVLYSPNLYRRQAWTLVFAALAPVAGNVLYQIGVTPVPYLDLTPFVFLVTGIATAWSLYRLRLLDVMPVARGSLIQSLREGIVVLNSQGRIVDLNPAAQHYLGLDEAAIGQPVQTVASHWPGLGEFCAAGGPARTEIMLDQGRPRYLELQLSPSADPHGGSAGSVLVVRDTTERKEAEAAEQARQVAEASYQMIRQVVETVGEGLVLLDQDRRVVMANRLGEAHLRLLASINGDGRVTALGGLPFQELLNPPEALPHHVITLAQPKRYHFELSIHPLPQMELWGGWLIVTRDVTQTRQIQQQMEQQGRLAAVGQLAAGIAHDFNNILAVIMLYTTLLQRSSNLLPKQREQLEVLRRQADHAGHLIQQILDFSRRAVIERVVIDLAPFLTELVELWRRTLPETITVALQV
ncbi:MAG TPA: histidine kinase N-terminal 7TM domain-containing protein, partial [Caldilineaceae bacterium]|nr:histidine kinase N-terminal 7TM domain-containing protein [Caldilineaceae bacterium]